MSEMKKCFKCGAVLRVEAKKCYKCGTKQSTKAKCPKCGANLPQTAARCFKCGAAFRKREDGSPSVRAGQRKSDKSAAARKAGTRAPAKRPSARPASGGDRESRTGAVPPDFEDHHTAEIMKQLEKYIYLALVAVMTIFVINSLYRVSGLSLRFYRHLEDFLFIVLLISVIIMVVYFLFRQRDLARIKSNDEKKFMVRKFMIGMFRRTAFFVVIIFMLLTSGVLGIAEQFTGLGFSTSFLFDTVIFMLLFVFADFGWFGYLLYVRKKVRDDELGITKEEETVEEEPEPKIIIEDVFLVEKNGTLITHQSRRLKPDMDDDVLMGMLTAIQSFMKDTFRAEGEGELNRLSYGDFTIMLEHVKSAYLAVVITGNESAKLRGQMRITLRLFHKKYSKVLEDWDGDVDKLRGAKDIINKYIILEDM